ncbi:nod factor hydrolase protein 1-like [Oryza brachyantha]|uniref:GH18 domain-containing protein n=1 Tax=Oryza brachyantha TaxID=4533 RepID=J3N879_ORYBR|nr:nod factor hydrolase protein 1-like [Oryza brachyantha]
MEQACTSLALIFLLAFLSGVSVSTSQHQCDGAPAGVRAGYWLPSSSHYSPLSSINTSLYSHLYYSSLSIDERSSTVARPPGEESYILSTFSSSIKSTGNLAVKIILSVGTDEYKEDVSNAAFSRMAADRNLRKMFINSSIELARANGFDGLDLAWRFPSTQMDMENLGVLLAEWRAAILDESGSTSSEPLLLTATVYFSNHLFDMSDSNLNYPIEDMSNNLDWVNILTFGLHKNSNITTADAPLYDKDSHFSASYGVISWLDAGLPPCKLVMGIPLFGRSWFLRNKDKNGLGAPTAAAGTKQRKSNQTGIIAYAEIEDYLKSQSVFVTHDNQSVADYFYSGDLWVTFDSALVVQEKIEFVVKSQLLGYFLWAISFDDLNCTLSKQASVSWGQYHDSSYAQGVLGIMQEGAVIQDLHASTGSPTSWYSKTISCLLSTILLLVVL